MQDQAVVSNGVKLENQVLVINNALENMTHFSFEEAFFR
tara:strand:+ start:498 stop:614 length:117 start_codon:yes stop_codon:yes gene_type:complete